VTALDRVAAVLERARVAGGWLDEEVSADVLKELGLDLNGDRVPTEPLHISSENGHG
jgi:hypothetical protein